MDVVSSFLERYKKEYDYYDQAARLVKQRLEGVLGSAGVRCIVTSRAKNVARLEDKCRQRNRNANYENAEQIFDDIVDLAGVRVALYFPAERGQVDRAVKDLFELTEDRKEFPDQEKNLAGRRFSGYSAVHYRVRLKIDDLGEPDKRYGLAKVEIQVASVLMHAWSEVEHDLVYKPLEGGLSKDEYAILDQINGMVIAGEIALETLQRAGDRRVAEGARNFANHYELAAHLLSRIDSMVDKPVGETGLGRVDVLLNFLCRVGIDTPNRLAGYLESLHGNLEVRPIADQVVDAILTETPSRFDEYRAAQDELSKNDSTGPSDDEVQYREVGRFMAHWVQLENALRIIAPPDDRYGQAAPMLRLLDRITFPSGVREEIDILRQIRNRVIHHETPPADDLAEITQRIESIIELISSQSPPEGTQEN